MLDAAVLLGFGLTLAAALWVADVVQKKFFPKPTQRGATRV